MMLQSVPGAPANRASAGMTVLGGMIVLSAILAQSLMMQNFPWSETTIKPESIILHTKLETHDDTVLPNLNTVSDSRSFNHTASSDVYKVTDLHRIVVEVALVGLVRRS